MSRSRPARQCSSVDLPEPDGPMIAVHARRLELDGHAVERAHLGLARAVDLGRVDGAGGRRVRGGAGRLGHEGSSCRVAVVSGSGDRGPRAGCRVPSLRLGARVAGRVGDARSAASRLVAAEPDRTTRCRRRRARCSPTRSPAAGRCRGPRRCAGSRTRTGRTCRGSRRARSLALLERRTAAPTSSRTPISRRGSTATRRGTSGGRSCTAGSPSGRCASEISRPHGSVVGLPNSSWLNQLPHRPIAWASEDARAPCSPSPRACRHVLAARDHDHRDRAADDRAPDRRARPSRSGTRERVVVEPLVVGDHVVQRARRSRPTTTTQNAMSEMPAIGVAAAAPPPLGHVHRDEDADREQHPVHVEAARGCRCRRARDGRERRTRAA